MRLNDEQEGSSQLVLPRFFVERFGLSGERGRNRTYNLVIKSHLLCQLSYAPVRCDADVDARPAAPRPKYTAVQPFFSRPFWRDLIVCRKSPKPRADARG